MTRMLPNGRAPGTSAGSFDFNIAGIDRLLDRMSVLPDKLQQQIGRRSARRAMLPVRDAARAAARAFDDPATKESIYRNVYIQQSARQSRRVGGVVMRVGVLGGARKYSDTRENRRAGRVGASYATLGDKGNPGGDTWYWRFLEFGTEKMRAQPFLRPALERNAQSVADALVTNISRDLDELAAGN